MKDFTAKTLRRGDTVPLVPSAMVTHDDSISRYPDGPTSPFFAPPRLRGETCFQIARPLLRTVQIIVAALREIFDENAYDLFLSRTKAVSSVASYRAFLREREAGIARKPRCC